LKETWEPLTDAVPQSALATTHPGSAHSAVKVMVPVSVWPTGIAELPLLSVTVLTKAKLPARGFAGTVGAAADSVPTDSAAEPVIDVVKNGPAEFVSCTDVEGIVESSAVADPEAGPAPAVPADITAEPPPVLLTAPGDADADATAPSVAPALGSSSDRVMTKTAATAITTTTAVAAPAAIIGVDHQAPFAAEGTIAAATEDGSAVTGAVADTGSADGCDG
jgi:hypothetical protein